MEPGDVWIHIPKFPQICAKECLGGMLYHDFEYKAKSYK